MADRKFKNGQIIRYIGPDLVTYEKGKTYTVLGYNKLMDMYGVMSELDEAYLLPEEVLEPLSAEEENKIKISDRMYEYYCYGINGLHPNTDIDEQRSKEIAETAKYDVYGDRLKREESEFESRDEYQQYLESLYLYANYRKSGIEKESIESDYYPIFLCFLTEYKEYEGKPDIDFDHRLYEKELSKIDTDRFAQMLGNAATAIDFAGPSVWVVEKKKLIQLFEEFSIKSDKSINSNIEKYFFVRGKWE